MSKYEPDKDAEIRIGAMRICHDCGEAINTDYERHLVSGILFWKRYRCEQCGSFFQVACKAELMERWVNDKK